MIRLTGTLRCASPDEAALAARMLPEHIRLTHAEGGCLRFSVTPMPDGLCWAVDEIWVDQAALAAHRARTAASAWVST
jgi:quinol monooxygenase YgiN